MPIDRGPWNALVDDDGSNNVGTLFGKEDIKTVILDPVDAAILYTPTAPVGALTAVPYNAADYGVYPSGTWTPAAGNVLAFLISQIGKVGFLTLYVANSPITGSPLLLSVQSPFPAPASRSVGTMRLSIGGALEAGSVYLETADNKFYFQRLGGQLFPAGTLPELSLGITVFLA